MFISTFIDPQKFYFNIVIWQFFVLKIRSLIILNKILVIFTTCSMVFSWWKSFREGRSGVSGSPWPKSVEPRWTPTEGIQSVCGNTLSENFKNEFQTNIWVSSQFEVRTRPLLSKLRRIWVNYRPNRPAQIRIVDHIAAKVLPISHHSDFICKAMSKIVKKQNNAWFTDN